MSKALWGTLGMAATLALPLGVSAAPMPSPTPSLAPLRTIYRSYTSPFCSRLGDHIRPVVGAILENDKTIAKSLPLFNRYGQVAMATGNSDSINNQNIGTSMALQQMSYLVSPIAKNLLAAQALLNDPVLNRTLTDPEKQKQLQDIRNKLLATLAYQSASLDLINGFVATQQMGEIQHAGEEYIGAIQGSDTTNTIETPAPNPLQDSNTPGLPQNPYSLDLTAVPGLAVGYNPLSRIIGAVQWTQSGTGDRENDAANAINAALAVCGATPSH